MGKIFSSIINRLAEPSSWAGLSTIAATGSHMIQTGNTSSDLIGAMLFGLAAVFAPERGKRD